MGAKNPLLQAQDYMGPPKRKDKTRKSAAPVDRTAHPDDDPSSLGRDSVNVDERLAKIAKLVELELWQLAQLESMKYAWAVVKAEGDMLDPDDDGRKVGLRYRQVNHSNWSEILDDHGYPQPTGVPSYTAIVTGTAGGARGRRSGGPAFIIHSEAPAKSTTGAAVVTEADEDKQAEIERRRKLLPPRPGRPS